MNIIYLSQAFHHADQPLKLLDECNRVLTNDPGIGVARHADAGYEDAISVAVTKGLKIPGLK